MRPGPLGFQTEHNPLTAALLTEDPCSAEEKGSKMTGFLPWSTDLPRKTGKSGRGGRRGKGEGRKRGAGWGRRADGSGTAAVPPGNYFFLSFFFLSFLPFLAMCITPLPDLEGQRNVDLASTYH